MLWKNIWISQVVLVLGFSLAMTSCSGESEDNSEEQQEEISSSLFSDDITVMNIDVYYEVGAEPRVGTIQGSASEVWDITETSYESLFQNHTGRTILVPKQLADMTEIDDQARESWTSTGLTSLGNRITGDLVTGTEATISLIFLNGTFEGNSSILGVHISGTPYAFVFKDVVESVAGTEKEKQYVEQATVVHELGHTVGLVNNGIPMAASHEDGEHPHHTTNEDGVMYWAVESSSDILSTILSYITGTQLDLFGNESLSDGRSYHP